MFFLVCCCAPLMEKIFFYYKALIFLKLFFIRVFVSVGNTHEISFSPKAELAAGYRSEDISHKVAYSKTALGGMFWVKEFFFASPVDCWSSRICFGEYGSLLGAKKSQFFSRRLRRKKFFRWFFDNYTFSRGGNRTVNKTLKNQFLDWSLRELEIKLEWIV